MHRSSRNTIASTDSQASVVWRGEYEPYGRIYALTASTDSYAQPLRFAGQDVATRSSVGTEERYNIFRWYRAGWGRYTSPDLIQIVPASVWLSLVDVNPTDVHPHWHIYGYDDGNPETFIDPLGLSKTYGCGAGCGYRFERDPHKGVHANWWCMGKAGCVKPDGSICEVGKSDPMPNRIRDCLKANGHLNKERCAIDQQSSPQMPSSPHMPSLPTMPPWLPWVGAGAAAATCFICPACCAAILPVL